MNATPSLWLRQVGVPATFESRVSFTVSGDASAISEADKTSIVSTIASTAGVATSAVRLSIGTISYGTDVYTSSSAYSELATGAPRLRTHARARRCMRAHAVWRHTLPLGMPRAGVLLSATLSHATMHMHMPRAGVLLSATISHATDGERRAAVSRLRGAMASAAQASSLFAAVGVTVVEVPVVTQIGLVAELDDDDDDDSTGMIGFAAVLAVGGALGYLYAKQAKAAKPATPSATATYEVNAVSHQPAPPAGGDDATLPAGWRSVTDPQSGRQYYANSATGETTWTHPAANKV